MLHRDLANLRISVSTSALLARALSAWRSVSAVHMPLIAAHLEGAMCSSISGYLEQKITLEFVSRNGEISTGSEIH